jgi:hypothetical protein
MNGHRFPTFLSVLAALAALLTPGAWPTGTPGTLAAQVSPGSDPPAGAGVAQALDPTLRPFAFLVGRWGIPPGDPVLEQRPALADMVILEIAPMVGGKALRYREHVPDRGAGEAELEGLVWWSPPGERVELLAVAGREDGQGRMFTGTLTPLADGRVEKVYDVYYRTLADTPGEELGGSRRRFREVWAARGPDVLTHSLEWWRDGRWQPWARGRYSLVRWDGGEGSSAASSASTTPR